MLNSDAPQPIKDRIYIPQEHSRKISHSEEAHDEGGGGFSFIFHQKGGKNTGEEQENNEDKTPVTEIGDAVEVHISGKAAHEQDSKEPTVAADTSSPAAESVKKDSGDDDDDQGKKRINITV